MIKSIIRKLIKAMNFLGFYPRKLITNVKGLGFYIRDYRKLTQTNNRDLFPIKKFYPILFDITDDGGTVSGHYFHQDLYVAQKIFEKNPKKHVDIGSRTDGFVAHVATFREIEVLDIRNIDSKVENIKFRQADLMNLPKDLINSLESISSLHAIEHFGLGRYGDPINHEGYLLAINNIYSMLKDGGTFYFSVPIGPQRIEFNAHRVFSISYLMEIFQDKFNVLSFSYVDDKGDLHKDQTLNSTHISNNFGCNYGCGIFELQKI